MEWEIKIVFVPSYGGELELLTEACKGGWEPYASNASFHYLKRVKSFEINPLGIPATEQQVVDSKEAISNFDTVMKGNHKKGKK